MTAKKKYLFIAGCARSGTTAMNALLNGHPKIHILTEGFQSNFKQKKKAFNESLFFKDNFLKESELTDIDFEQLRYIGDKVPGYYKDYERLFQNFPNSKVIFMVRNIFDVASSYKARKKHPTNPWKKGIRMAVKDWNESLIESLRYIEKGYPIYPLIYEQVFFRNKDFLSSILELAPDPMFESKMNKTLKHAKKIELNKQSTLESADKLWIMKNARFDLYKKLIALETT